MTQIPRAEANGQKCPLWRKPVEKVCHTCPWYARLQGTNQNTGEPVDSWGCTIPMLAMLQHENSAHTRGVAAAIESFRNELVTGVVEAVTVAGETAGRLIDARDDSRRR